MASTTTRLLSWEEFEQLPESDWMRQELHHGELFEMPPPVQGHKRIERRLRRFLEDAGSTSRVVELVGFRPVIGNEYWIADVALVSNEQWDGTPADGYIIGAPELVIEVLSPSNTRKKMADRRKICLGNGSREFWVVDPKKREVEVSMPSGQTTTYKAGQEIPIFFAPETAIAVDAIFD